MYMWGRDMVIDQSDRQRGVPSVPGVGGGGNCPSLTPSPELTLFSSVYSK
jgi:hypothetical protein